MNSCIKFDEIEARIDDLRDDFHLDSPLKHVIIDNFLNADAYRAIISGIPAPEKQHKSNDYVFARNKFENPNFHTLGDAFASLKDEFLSDRFAAILSKIYGRELFVDPTFVGGGLHQGGERSFLDMHADFNRHPANHEWLRELNILLYLNDDYKDEYGGHLQLENAVTGAKGQVAPLPNRMVFMLTKEHTLHGYREVRFPPGRYRTSIAAYAYSIDRDQKSEPARSTKWRPNTGGPLKAAVARVSPMLVAVKNGLFGSGTVKRAGDSRGPGAK